MRETDPVKKGILHLPQGPALTGCSDGNGALGGWLRFTAGATVTLPNTGTRRHVKPIPAGTISRSQDRKIPSHFRDTERLFVPALWGSKSRTRGNKLIPGHRDRRQTEQTAPTGSCKQPFTIFGRVVHINKHSSQNSLENRRAE